MSTRPDRVEPPVDWADARPLTTDPARSQGSVTAARPPLQATPGVSSSPPSPGRVIAAPP
jgi:hypothetical protein